MRINEDPLALGLFEDRLEVLESCPGDEYGLSFFRPRAALPWGQGGRMSRVRGIEKLHHLQVDLAAFQYEAQPFVEAELILDNLGKRLV